MHRDGGFRLLLSLECEMSPDFGTLENETMRVLEVEIVSISGEGWGKRSTLKTSPSF